LKENVILIKCDIREKDQVFKMKRNWKVKILGLDTIIHNAINDLILMLIKKIDVIEWQDF